MADEMELDGCREGDTDLPEGWDVAALSDVARARLGKTPKRTDYRNSGEHRVVKFRDVTNTQVDYTASKDAYVIDTHEALKGMHELAVGDVLVTAAAHSGDQIGKKVGYVTHLPSVAGGVYFTGELLGITSYAPAMVDKWTYYFFQSTHGFECIQKAVAGVHLTAGRAQRIPIPLAPLAEQKRIVAKVEEVLAQVNAARDRLAKVPAILKGFRQSVLAAACSGRLTADWRENHPDVEPASELLKRILAERRRKWEEAEAAKMQASGKPPKDGKWKEKYKEAAEPDISDLPELPDGWTWVRLPEMGEMNRGRSRHRPRNASFLYGGPHPFIQTGDIAQSGGRIASHRQTYSDAGLAQSRLWPEGTICITIAANIADSAILTYPACFPDSVVGLIPDEGLAVGEYAEFFIRTARDNLSQFAPATAQKNINVAILNDVSVPLPPLPEQEEIVRRVEALFALADGIEKSLRAATLRTEKLTQAILAKAFRGELVPTEADLARKEGRTYEPASVLLDRIRRERAEQTSRTGQTSRTRRTGQTEKGA